MIIDSHCHLTYEPMFSSLKETIKRANNDGVKFLLTISTEDKNFKNILNLVENYNSVYGTYGIHPHEAKKHKSITSNNICVNVKKNKKIIGIGETGLDFFYNHSDKQDQISLFLEHIDASHKTSLHVKEEIHDVTILHRVVFAFATEFASFFDCFFISK